MTIQLGGVLTWIPPELKIVLDHLPTTCYFNQLGVKLRHSSLMDYSM